MEKVIEIDGVKYELTENDFHVAPDCDFCELNDCIKEKCNFGYYYKKIEEKKDMKLEELKFKVIIDDEKRFNIIQQKLLELGICWKGKVASHRNLFSETYQVLTVFKLESDRWRKLSQAPEDIPEVTFNQALDLIAQVEVVKPEPKFDIEFQEDVLYHDDITNEWHWDQFGCIPAKHSMFACLVDWREKIIKLEGNENLLGTTDTPKGWWKVKDGKPIWVNCNE